MRYILLLMMLIAAVPFVPQAQAQTQTQQAPEEKFVQDLGNRAIAVMADKSLSADQRTQTYRELLRNAFDLQTIGHFVLGRAWTTASSEQKKNFLQLFEQMVLNTYGNRLSFYTGEGFKVKSARQESDKDAVVNSEVTHANGTPPTPVDWRIRNQDGKMSVIDVVVEGVSQSVTQRQEFAAIIQHDNGNIDGLLAQMKQRLQNPQ